MIQTADIDYSFQNGLSYSAQASALDRPISFNPRLSNAIRARRWEALSRQQDGFSATATTSRTNNFSPALNQAFQVSEGDATPRYRAIAEAIAGNSIRASMWFAPPLSAEIVSRIITDGAFTEMLSWLRKELKVRHEMVHRIISRQHYHSQPTSYHVWVELPDPWRGEELVTELRHLGVIVMSSETFAIDRAPQPHAIRICLCGEADRAKLERGLEIIAKTLNLPPPPGLSVI